MANTKVNTPRDHLLSSRQVQDANSLEQNQLYAADVARRAGKMIEDGRHADAEQILRLGLERVPDHQDCLTHMAVCLAAGRRKFVSAEKLAKNLIKTNPYDARGYYALGRVNLIGSRRGSAFRNLEKAKDLADGDSRMGGTLENLDPRRPPVISWLPRNNVINIWLGRWRAALQRK
jgi:hypothetical protein